MSQQLQFKISSALKNIIGRDLINDDFIAVFELVKNSYDAHATKVDIVFENIYSKDAKIIIQDNGKGMSFDDLINKWLFVAYSAKKEGTEEDSFDYRDKIKIKRAYAGAKGIGRFSCDRLGSHLYLETKKDEPNAKIESLYTDWDKFDGDLKDEFINVSVLHETLPSNAVNYSHGTKLEITSLHSEWDRKKFLDLRDALAKLINPNSQNHEDTFEITLYVKEESEKDEKQKDYRDKVNGKIQNLIFETLDLKTTKIVSEIKSTEIVSELFEGGKTIYKIQERNNLKYLSDIHFSIYFLNRSAKHTFSRRMGVQPVEYGHIFMYKNGLRIYPYGERGEDPLKMDNRKAQGYSRYLGTREVIGYIDIKGNNDDLRETSSRGDGLIKTKAYYELEEWFLVTLRRLEKYGIDIIDWGNVLSEDDYISFNKIIIKDEGTDKEKVFDVNKNLRDLIHRLTNSENIISYELAPEIFSIIENKQSTSPGSILKSVKEDIISDNFEKKDIIEKINKAEKKIEVLKQIKDEAEQEAFEHLIKNEELIQNLEAEIKQGVFQRSIIGTDKERILGLQHQIYHSSSRISRNIKLLLQEFPPELLTEQTKNRIKIISLEASKINSIANFITKANFDVKAEAIETDLIAYIESYIREIYTELEEDGKPIVNSKIKNIKVNNKEGIEYIIELRPLEISSLIDNFILNSEKASASQLLFDFYKNETN